MREKIAVIAAVCFSAATVWGQPDGDVQPTPSDAAAGDANGSAQSAQPDTDAQPDAQTDGSQAATSQRPMPTNLTPAQLVLMHDAEIEQLNQQIEELTRRMEDLQLEIRTLQSRLLDESPTSAQDLLGAMSRDATLRKNLGSVAQGKINLINYTGDDAMIFINGTRWRAASVRAW